jgi:hypothetical protein
MIRPAIAQSFGDVELLLDKYVHVYNPSALLEGVAERVTVTDPHDYLLLTGNVLLNVMTMAVWMQHHNMCRVLAWSQRDGAYRVIDVTPSLLDGALESALINVSSRGQKERESEDTDHVADL